MAQQKFSRYNQPRTCEACGKRYSDSNQDSGERVCPECYERCGILNEHTDGHHRPENDGPQAECPNCMEAAQAEVTANVRSVTDEDNEDEITLEDLHDAGEHGEAVKARIPVQGCVSCSDDVASSL